MKEPDFLSPARRFQVGEIAVLTGARLVNAEHAKISVARLAPASEGGVDALVFIDGRRNADKLPATFTVGRFFAQRRNSCTK